jgi:hypothetical protein
MIKKTTKVKFEGEETNGGDEQIGGMPLSKGELVHIHRNGQVINYEVTNKKIDYFDETEDKLVNITYTLKRL